MPITIDERHIPNLINWFNGFIGFREIQKRAERVDEKLNSVGFPVPALLRRFYFHRAYIDVVTRNRKHERINLRDVDNTRALSLVAAAREASNILSEAGKVRLKSRIVEALGPDRDIREFEHEMRAFIHYRQAHLPVILADYENIGRFDFLVSGPRGEFEVECKTFSESIGSAISIDQSLIFFRGFAAALEKSRVVNESGVLTMTVAADCDLSESEITDVLSNFLNSAAGEASYASAHVKFEVRPEWDKLVNRGDLDGVSDAVIEAQRVNNPHVIVALSSKRALMFCLLSRRRPRIFRGICERLKDASNQFSKSRPAIIWAHFFAPDENEFLEVTQGHEGARPFDVFARYVFRSDQRRHVCRLRFSADGERVSERRIGLILPQNARNLAVTGPAYDYRSERSAFDPEHTV